MNTFFIIALFVLIFAIIATLIIIIVKITNQTKQNIKSELSTQLEKNGFQPLEIHYINRFLTIAINSTKTKLAIIQGYNPNIDSKLNYFEIPISLITKIEKNIYIKLHYSRKGERQILNIYPITNEIKDFIHEVYSLTIIKKIQHKFPQNHFTYYSASDWQCSFFWAYDDYNGTLAYYSATQKPYFGKINLKKEHFTIDTKYKYFEAPIFGIAQQLFTYKKDFLPNVFNSILQIIKEKTSEVNQDSIYFDNYSTTIYLTNGTTSLQSVIIPKIEDVYYKDNRMSFALLNEPRTINFISNTQQIADFEDFAINYNLKKIATGFDYKTDKLINATPYTKFIIDFTRDRIVYCANLNRFARFGYIIVSFDNLNSVITKKSGAKNFTRITTKDKNIIDVTCDKQEVALYIKAQLDKIIENLK